MDTPRKYLTTAEAAAVLCRSQGTIIRWADENKLRIAAVAGKVRLFDRADVEALASKLAGEAEAEAAALRGATA